MECTRVFVRCSCCRAQSSRPVRDTRAAMERPMRRSVLLERIAQQQAQVKALRRLETMARHAAYRSKRLRHRAAAPATLLVYQQALLLNCAEEEAVLLRAALRIRGEARDDSGGIAAVATTGVSASDAGHPRHHVIGRRGAGRLAAIRCLAAQYIAETRVAMWLATCNVRGVAPVTSDLVAELCRQWPDAGVSSQSLHLLARLRFASGPRRKWARRFRLRWRVTWRRLAARSELPASTQAAKACSYVPKGPFL